LFTLILDTGERLKGRRLSVEQDNACLEELSVGIEKLSLPLKNLVSVLCPSANWKTSPKQEGFWVMLADGSILRARNQKGLALSRLPECRIETPSLAALWGNQSVYQELPAAFSPGDGQIFVLEGEQAVQIREWSWGAAWIETPGWKPPHPLTYETSPTVWFGKVPAPDKNTGLLQLTSGERIVLKNQDKILLKGLAGGEITITHGNLTFNIPASEVLSIVFPKK